MDDIFRRVACQNECMLIIMSYLQHPPRAVLPHWILMVQCAKAMSNMRQTCIDAQRLKYQADFFLENNVPQDFSTQGEMAINYYTVIRNCDHPNIPVLQRAAVMMTFTQWILINFENPPNMYFRVDEAIGTDLLQHAQYWHSCLTAWYPVDPPSMQVLQPSRIHDTLEHVGKQIADYFAMTQSRFRFAMDTLCNATNMFFTQDMILGECIRDLQVLTQLSTSTRSSFSPSVQAYCDHIKWVQPVPR